MADYRKMLLDLVPGLSGRALVEAESAMRKLSEKDDGQPWRSTVLKGFADAVSKHGPAGVSKAREALKAILGGRDVELDFADLAYSSELLAVMQNLEADHKKKAQDYINLVGDKIGVLIGAMLRGIAS